jgi:cytochrome P450
MTTSKTSSSDLAPGPKGTRILGSLSDFAANPLELLQRCQRDYGNVASMRLGKLRGTVLSHPDHIRHVLQANNKNYNKGTRGIQKLRAVLGLGLITSDGEFWFRQRKIAQPAFKKERIAAYADVMAEVAEDALNQFPKKPGLGKPFMVDDTMMQLTLRVVGEALLGQDVSNKASVVGQALETVMEISNKRLVRAFDIPLSWPTPENRRFRKAVKVLDQVMHDLIQTHRRLAVNESNLLSMLIHARDPDTGEGMTDAQLRDEVVTLFLAGHETTANALTWLWYLLGKHPEVEAKLHDEVDSVVGDRVPTLADADRLVYTTAVIKETMRLYPPVWLFARHALGDDTIGGYAIPKGTTVWMPPYVVHRHPDLWDRPNTFDPERFLSDNASTQYRFAYFPFGGGPRQCIGLHFAMLEMQIIVAMLARKFRFVLDVDHPIDLQARVTLRPRFGLQMSLETR